MKTIKILGNVLADCKMLEENIKLALEKTGIKANVEKITDIEEIMSYDIMKDPGLVINKEVMSYGRVNSVEEIIWFLENEEILCCDGDDSCCNNNYCGEENYKCENNEKSCCCKNC